MNRPNNYHPYRHAYAYTEDNNLEANAGGSGDVRNVHGGVAQQEQAPAQPSFYGYYQGVATYTATESANTEGSDNDGYAVGRFEHWQHDGYALPQSPSYGYYEQATSTSVAQTALLQFPGYALPIDLCPPVHMHDPAKGRATPANADDSGSLEYTMHGFERQVNFALSQSPSYGYQGIVTYPSTHSYPSSGASTPVVQTPPQLPHYSPYIASSPPVHMYNQQAQGSFSGREIHLEEVDISSKRGGTASGSRSPSRSSPQTHVRRNPRLPARPPRPTERAMVTRTSDHSSGEARLVPRRHLTLAPNMGILDAKRLYVVPDQLAADTFHTQRDERGDMRRVPVKISCPVPGCGYVGDPYTFCEKHVVPEHYPETRREHYVQCIYPGCPPKPMKRSSMARHMKETHQSIGMVHCIHCHATVRDDQSNGARVFVGPQGHRHRHGDECSARAEYVRGTTDALTARNNCKWCRAEVILN
ncbi:hypothetical protein L227DRAFT_633952 [Lentinus tigrinus ALCF2SS1-6]|uniref:Uncharacterized protein n=1 Tax=Lentinus tigrinus ALCF2SS1-6 TaxID=1328759 RepID=A0A5C2RZP7_9APHY|nr:hypothetical protein L227DRAFT_633952 [Lentinus tigrinus ALCF2SS1-6]